MSLQSHFEDDVVVTTIRKITEFSPDDCQSFKSTRPIHSSLPDISKDDDDDEEDDTLANDVLEENAIFEHESSLYGGDVFESVVERHLSDSGTADDDELTVGSSSGRCDAESSLSSSSQLTSSSDERSSNDEVIIINIGLSQNFLIL
jgi:hypothetical protein